MPPTYTFIDPALSTAATNVQVLSASAVVPVAVTIDPLVSAMLNDTMPAADRYSDQFNPPYIN
jgi:hypothetical protein